LFFLLKTYRTYLQSWRRQVVWGLLLLSIGLWNSYFPTRISGCSQNSEFPTWKMEIRLRTSMERYFLLGNS